MVFNIGSHSNIYWIAWFLGLVTADQERDSVPVQLHVAQSLHSTQSHTTKHMYYMFTHTHTHSHTHTHTHTLTHSHTHTHTYTHQLKEFRQAAEDRHTHLYQNPYYPSPESQPKALPLTTAAAQQEGGGEGQHNAILKYELTNRI